MLLQFSNICDLQIPEKFEVLAIQDYIFKQREKKGPSQWFMMEPEDRAYYLHTKEEPDPQDFVLVQKQNEEKDIVPYFIRFIYHKLTGDRMPASPPIISEQCVLSLTCKQLGTVTEDLEGQIHYKRSKLITLGNWIVPVVASVLLIVAIIILFLIKDTMTRLYTMIPLTVIFAVAIKIFTSASRAEIFAAVAG